jgi:hypothetical protein
MRSLCVVPWLLAGGLALTSASAAGQLPENLLSLEIRAGALTPLADWNVEGETTDLRVGAGPALDGVLRVALTPAFSLYGSYRWARPSCTDCDLFALDQDLGDAGFGFGVGFVIPGTLPFTLRTEVGGLAHQLSFRGGGDSRPSDWGFGGEVGFAASFEVSPSLFLEPGLGGSMYPARFEFEEGDFREVRVQYLTPRIGLRYQF